MAVHLTPEMRVKSRSLRHHMTKAEVLLWLELRELKRDGLHFRKQSPMGSYIVDFACRAAKLVVEIDGDLHETPAAQRHDELRDAWLGTLGYKVMRIDQSEVIENSWQVAQQVRATALLRRGPTRPLRGHPPLTGAG